MTFTPTRDRIAVLAGVAAPLLVAAVLMPVRTDFSNTDAALLLVAVVVAVAAFGNRIAGYLAAASSAAWFDFFLTRPYQQFTITRRADIETTVLLLAIGVAVTELAVWGRRGRRRQPPRRLRQRHLRRRRGRRRQRRSQRRHPTGQHAADPTA